MSVPLSYLFSSHKFLPLMCISVCARVEEAHVHKKKYSYVLRFEVDVGYLPPSLSTLILCFGQLRTFLNRGGKELLVKVHSYYVPCKVRDKESLCFWSKLCFFLSSDGRFAKPHSIV